MIEKVVIIGVGLIGGSLAKSLKERRYANTIIGFGRQADKLQKALDLGVIDAWTLNLAQATQNANVVIIATPLGVFDTLFSQLAPLVSRQTLIIDVGSAKQSSIKIARQYLGDKIGQFIPTHPITGKEKSGIEFADANLFNNKHIILTPITENKHQDIDIITKFWQATGGVVDTMDAKTHDEILAMSSHLPHILAFSLMDYLSHQDRVYDYAAGGFRDFSRIASSDSTMWRDICLSNKDEIVNSIQAYEKHLKELKQLIKDEKGQKLYELFKSAKTKRDNWIEECNKK